MLVIFFKVICLQLLLISHFVFTIVIVRVGVRYFFFSVSKTFRDLFDSQYLQQLLNISVNFSLVNQIISFLLYCSNLGNVSRQQEIYLMKDVGTHLNCLH